MGLHGLSAKKKINRIFNTKKSVFPFGGAQRLLRRRVLGVFSLCPGRLRFRSAPRSTPGRKLKIYF
jgi:hypothetical protein